jgi:hypothetical protein
MQLLDVTVFEEAHASADGGIDGEVGCVWFGSEKEHVEEEDQCPGGCGVAFVVR